MLFEEMQGAKSYKKEAGVEKNEDDIGSWSSLQGWPEIFFFSFF